MGTNDDLRTTLKRIDAGFWELARRWFVRIVVITAVIGLAAGIWMTLIEPDQLVVRRIDIEPVRWPNDLNGFRIVAISDLHVGSPHMTLEKIREVVVQANRNQPDLIVLLGDYVIRGIPGGTFVTPEVFAPLLGKLAAKHGVFAVLGNHDWQYDGERVTRAFGAAGIKVLTNDAIRVAAGAGGFNLVGVGDCFTFHDDLNRAFSGVEFSRPVIAITHTPDVFAKLPGQVDLLLAGHTHGGQVNLPFLGRLVVPSNYGQKYAAGYVEEDGRRLFVTTGIGTSILPIRFRVTPEIVVMTLKEATNGVSEARP